MGTEDRSEKFIDEMRPYAAVVHLLKELEAPRAVKRAKKSIHEAVLAIAKRLEQGKSGRIVYVGAGTSGRLGTLDGSELYPTFGWPQDRIVQIVAGGDKALKESIEGAEDRTTIPEVIVDQLKLNSDDVMIAVAVSGTTPFVLAAMRQAKKRGALTVGITNNAERPLLLESDHPIFLDTGPELVAGSTRMKAGSAQHATLKTISTLVMVRLGFVYQGLMVNVRASNVKLKKRAIEMVQTITSCTEAEAQEALEAAQWEVGVAVLLRNGKALACAQTQFLKIHKRSLRDVFDADAYIQANTTR